MEERECGANIPAELGIKFEKMAGIMARLRSPDGCPWDLEQTPEALSRHILEEAYEAVEAIDAGDWQHLEEELGDLLLQIVFQSRIAEEQGRFDLADVVEGISEKLRRRHPHIFGSVEADSAEQVAVNWDLIKREEGAGSGESVSFPEGLPAMMAALKIQGQARRAGFDWSDGRDVFGKLQEEVTELGEALGESGGALEREMGDLLFTVVNLARHLGVDPEKALRGTCREFVARYRSMEESAAREGRSLGSMSLDEKDILWERAKSERRGARGE